MGLLEQSFEGFAPVEANLLVEVSLCGGHVRDPNQGVNPSPPFDYRPLRLRPQAARCLLRLIREKPPIFPPTS